MLTRPHYSKSVLVNAGVVKRKLKPRHHSISIDAPVNLLALPASFQSAREYNLSIGRPKYIYSVMVIFYGVSKDDMPRDSSTPLITLASPSDKIMKDVEKALNKLRQSDAKARFMRIVYDIDKNAAKEQSTKNLASVQTAAKNLNVAKSFGFKNFSDYKKALKELNAKNKHGATEAGLKQAAKRLYAAKAKPKKKAK